MTKVAKYVNKNVDLETLINRVKDMIVNENFRVTIEDSTEYTHHLKAIKTNVTRIILGTARDIEVIIAGESDNFAVALIVGAWGKNIAMSGVTGFVIASTVAAPAFVVGTVAAAGSYLTALSFEEKMFQNIEKEVSKLSPTSPKK
jgi:hypothetical protein